MKHSRLVALIVFFTTHAVAREIGTPLIFQRGPIHDIYSELNHDCWFFNIWTGFYDRTAKKAFNCAGKETPLTTLYFNKPNFNAQEAFPASMAESPLNPLLATSILGPRIKFKDTGVTIGTVFQGYISENCRIGFRANIPLRKIEIRRTPSCGNGSSDLGGQTVKDVAATKNETVNGVVIPNSFAYRLDFLSRLPYTCEDCPAREFVIVNYSDTDFPPKNPITISNQDVTDQNGTPVTVLGSSSGTVPSGQFALPQDAANALPPLNSTGSSIMNNGRARFDDDIIYTPLGSDADQQAELFVVPTVADGRKVAAARVIQQHVQELIDCIDQDAEAIFKQCGISFNSQCVKGKGDLDTEIFAGYFFSPCLYGEAFGGIRWPTGQRSNNPLRVFKPSLGNNGHYEFRLGLQSLWQAHPWVSLKGDLSWTAVQRGEECVAAPFQGAQIKNIGRPLGARIAWDYVVLHADILITPYCNTGIDVGYELYHKSCDDLCFDEAMATDCLRTQALLDSTVLSRNTEVTGHKIRADAFWFCDWFELYGGGSKVVAGKNVPQDTDWHIGLTVYF